MICIDAPQLDYLEIVFFNQIDFDSPRLAQFLNRTPKFRSRGEAHVQFYGGGDVVVRLKYWTHKSGHAFWIKTTCREPDWPLSFIAQVLNSSLPPLSMVEDLYIGNLYWGPVWKNDTVENTLWLELLLPFTAVKNLYLRREFAPSIVAALQELVGDRITEVLPSLRNIFVRMLEPLGPFQEHIGQFVAARQLSGHPVAISVWD